MTDVGPKTVERFFLKSGMLSGMVKAGREKLFRKRSEAHGGEKRLFTGCSLGVYYDSDVLNYDGYTFVDGEEEYRAVLDASNAEFKGNSVKIVSIAHYGNEEQETKDGAIMKLTFKVKKAEKTELRLSNRLTDLGYDTYFTVRVDDKDITCTDATQLYIDTTPIIINQ